ncbi:hypothetical protein HKCCE4037_01935 [Rhodobacterales bacterium HKCCE4037]|nr:hypothetical protein [Rhodobacterales bacterium HKCCE4037]
MTYTATTADLPDELEAEDTIRNAQPAATGYIGLAVLVTCFAMARSGVAFTGADGFLQACAVMFLVMAAYDCLIHRVYLQPDVGALTWSGPLSRTSLILLAYKSVGVLVSVGLAFVAYSTFPLYQDAWYQLTFSALAAWLPVMVPAFVIYLVGFHFATHRRDDALAQFGRFCATLGRDGDRALVRDHLLGLAIKVFFIPLMVGFGLTDWGRLSTFDLAVVDFRSFYEAMYQLLLLVDVCFGVIGYVCSFRLLGAHVRFPERTAGGWLFCLMCYVPFWQIINRNFLTYNDTIVWGTVFAENSVPYLIWGSTILFLMTVYALSTVSFGYRFSNLTYRGVVCSGPYRYMRHPAYVSKNLSYWMIEMPVLGSSFASAASGTVALVLVNLIYLMRARYEERCCLQHEDYRIYYARFRRHE